MASIVQDLNPMQLAFCEALLADPKFNATDAARQAGYKMPEVYSNRLMRTQKIRRYLGLKINDRMKDYRLAQEDVLDHLRNALMLDPLEMFEPVNGNGVWKVKSLDEVPLAVRRCIQGVKCKTRTFKDGREEQFIEITLMSKDHALKNAMMHLGLLGVGAEYLIQQQAVNVEVNLGDLLQEIKDNRRVIDTDFIEQKADDSPDPSPDA